MGNGLDLLLFEGKGFNCKDVICDSFFTTLKIMHPENFEKVFEVSLPSSYIQFVLKIPTSSKEQKSLGFDIGVFDSDLEGQKKD